jgi:hypothetical protein
MSYANAASPGLGDRPDGEAVQRTAAEGGPGGRPFVTPVVPPGGRLISIQVKAGNYIDKIRFVYEDAARAIHTVDFGGDGGEWQEAHDVPTGVYLIGISGMYGDYIDSIRFHFSDGSASPDYGGDEGKRRFEIFLPKKDGHYFGAAIGFFGREGKYVDQIGIQYRPQ